MMITKFNLYKESLLTPGEIFTIRNDKLIIDDIIRDYFLHTKVKTKNDYHNSFCEDRRKDIHNFLSKPNYGSFRTCFHFRYGSIYSMSINIKKNKFNGSNDFTYYISGMSGDFSMHQKGMIRATRTINLEVIKYFFPDVKKNKQYRDFEKRLIKFSDLELYSNGIYENFKKSQAIKSFKI